MICIVVIYNKKTEDSNSFIFDTEDEALKFVSDNYEIKKLGEKKDLTYKIFNALW